MRLVFIATLLCSLIWFFTPVSALAEGEDTPYSSDIEQGPPPGPPPAGPTKPGNQKQDKRKYFIPDTQRVDAGIFHVAFAGGGNFYIEPKINATTREATGDYFKDFGFQVGVLFDYDYSALTENVPFALRMMVGYKYILNSVHFFSVDGTARYMFRVSDYSSFGLGVGFSTGLWYRAITDLSRDEETILLSSFVIEGGFDFNPFMVDLKWVTNRLGSDSTIMGFELNFGVRL